MSLKKFISRRIVSVVIIISIVFIGVITNLAKTNMDKAVINTTLSEMNQIGVQIETSLEQTLKESKNDLLVLSEYISKNNVPFDELGYYLNNQSKTTEFETLYFINTDGHGYSLDGHERDFSDNEAFLHALQNEFVVTEPQISYISDKITFDFAVPVIEHGEIIAVLFSEGYISDFLKNVNLSTDGTGDIFIVDHDLNLVFSTSENHTGTSIIPEGDVAEIGMDIVTIALSEIRSQTTGGFYYDYYGSPKVMVYFPIENTEWALAINVEVDGINAILTSAITVFK